MFHLTKLLLTLGALFAIANCYAIERFNFKNQDEKFEAIRKEAEIYYQTLPRDVEEDARLLVPQLIEKYGYPVEVHTVATSDGYILEMHRIPYGKEGPSEDRPAVYLQHGIMCSSADWVIAGPEKGFGYILADAGYDVWMTNVRGNRYSRKHVSLDPDKDAKKFWDFSWHEIGTIDVPAMVDYVIAQTNQEKIFYIGHSQGTTVSYVMMSEQTEYNDKFRAVFSLAPIAYMRWMTSPLLRIIALFEWSLEVAGNILGMYEFLPHSEFLGIVGDVLCGDDSILQILCTNALFAVCGFNPAQMNATLLPVIMGHTPAGASTKQVYHYAQEINSGKFRQYDYGMFENMNRYGSMSPPKYKLSKVKAPVYLHYSRNDWLSNEKDVNKLYDELGNVKGKFLSPDNKFNHADYLFGIDAPELLYRRVISLMVRH